VDGRRAQQPNPNCSDEKYLNDICEFVGEKFGGCSISHVSGRFRAAKLMTQSQAHTYSEQGEGYLVDETTAVVRFIVPYRATMIVRKSDRAENSRLRDLETEERQTVFLFEKLFVNAVTVATATQDQIWVLEHGKKPRLLRYVSSERDDG
jgi:hypothetical protein